MYWHPDEQLGDCGTFLRVAGGELWGPAGSDRVVAAPAVRAGQPVAGNRSGHADRPLPGDHRGAAGTARGTVRGGAGPRESLLRDRPNWYSGDVRITNHGSRDLSLYLYHAADCHLPDGGFFGVSYGYAFTAPFVIRGVGCSQHPDNRPTGARQVLLPTTLGDQGYSYMQGFYQTVWDRVSAGFALSNTVSENVQWDTAMAVGWLYDGLPVGAPVDFNYVASFAMRPRRPSSRPSSRRRRPQPTPQPPVPGPQPPEPQDPASVVIRDPVFVPPTGGSADVIGRCSTRPGGRCFVEVGSGLQRRAAVVRRGQLARLRSRSARRSGVSSATTARPS